MSRVDRLKVLTGGVWFAVKIYETTPRFNLKRTVVGTVVFFAPRER